MVAQQNRPKQQESVSRKPTQNEYQIAISTCYSKKSLYFQNIEQFASRWNETTPLQSCAQQQPELQLNMNSQGGFVPQFINNSPTSRAENNPSPGSDSSFQVS